MIDSNRSNRGGVFWRGPAQFQELVRTCAKDHELTANAFITSGMLFSLVVFENKKLRQADAIVRLVGEIVEAAKGDRSVLGTCTETEWESAEWFTGVLYEAGLSELPEKRPDDRLPDTVVFTFRLTRPGREIWNNVGERLLLAYKGLQKTAP